MKKFVFSISAIFLTVFLAASCSSLPGKKETRVLDIKNKAAGYLQDGNSQFNAGRYSRALELFNLAYQLNASVDNQEGLVASLNSIGRINLFQGKEEQAFNFFQQALTISERLQNIPLIMKTKGNLADYYVKTEELDKAESLLKEQLKEYGPVDSPESALLAHNLSLVLRKKKNYSDARLWLDKSLNYNLKNKQYRETAADYYLFASISSLEKDYENAFLYAGKALDFDKMIEYSQGIAADLEALSIISEKMGNSSDAQMYSRRGKAVLDAINAINKIEEEQAASPQQETAQ